MPSQRVLRSVVAGVGATLLTAAAFLTLADGPCEEGAGPDLALSEIGAVRRKVEAHQRAPSGALQLTEREANFLLQGWYQAPVQIGLSDDVLRVDWSVRALAGRCWPVQVIGRAELDGIMVEQAWLGRLELSRWLRGERWRLSDLPEPRLAELAPRVRALSVQAGELHLHLEPEGAP